VVVGDSGLRSEDSDERFLQRTFDILPGFHGKHEGTEKVTLPTIGPMSDKYPTNKLTDRHP